MRKTAIFAGLVFVAFVAVLSSAEAATFTWGDFTFADNVNELDAWAFYNSESMFQPSNPAGFPAPVPVSVTGIYIPSEPDRLTANTLKNFLADAKCPSNIVAFYLKIAGGSTTLSQLSVAIDNTAANSGSGPLILTPGVYGILTDLNLDDFTGAEKIQVTYIAPIGSKYIQEMKFGCDPPAVPEPVSMAFLGTGLLGIILARVRRRR